MIRSIHFVSWRPTVLPLPRCRDSPPVHQNGPGMLPLAVRTKPRHCSGRSKVKGDRSQGQISPRAESVEVAATCKENHKRRSRRYDMRHPTLPTPTHHTSPSSEVAFPRKQLYYWRCVTKDSLAAVEPQQANAPHVVQAIGQLGRSERVDPYGAACGWRGRGAQRRARASKKPRTGP